ncbi:hypothetical protein GCM10009540_62300 [Streptomyces turgidiscabies]
MVRRRPSGPGCGAPVADAAGFSGSTETDMTCPLGSGEGQDAWGAIGMAWRRGEATFGGGAVRVGWCAHGGSRHRVRVTR